MKSLKLVLVTFIFSFFSWVILVKTVWAQQYNPVTTCERSFNRTRAIRGLVSTPQLFGKFNSDIDQCVIDLDKAAVAVFEIPTYEKLKDKFYARSKSPHKRPPGQGFSGTGLYLLTTDQNFTNLTVNDTIVAFIDGNLTISNNITYGSNTAGLVLVVRGDINIGPNVTQMDAVIISDGTICTYFNGSCPVASVQLPTSSRLVVNGSLVSLNRSSPIRLARSLNNNNIPAEQVIFQARYLATLQNLFSENIIIFSED